MKKNIAILFMIVVSNLCHAQSLEEDKIYLTQFLNYIFLDKQLRVNTTKVDNSIIHVIESNDKYEVTRELSRTSDSTFLYTEYEPMHCEEYLESFRNRHITKRGLLVFSNETVVDSSEMPNPETYGNYPNPRDRNIYKQTGEWFEKYNGGYNMIKGSYNENGKQGEWNYYTFRRELDKVLTYENGKLLKEDYVNYLNYESIEKSSNVIQGTWYMYNNIMYADFHDNASTYTFEQDGTVMYTFKRMEDGVITGFTRKGTWKMPDFETLEFTVNNRTRTLNLKYLRDKRIRYEENK